MDKQIKFRILIADDDPDLLDILSDEFSSSVHDVFLAPSGMEAIDILMKERINLVISDFRMPNGNGMSILNFVNSMDDKPIFFLFSGEVDIYLKSFKKLGASQVFSKPRNFLKLIVEVHKESLFYFDQMKVK